MTFALDMLPRAASLEAVDVAQGSPEWLALRRGGIGGSDLVRVLTRPWDLWMEKTGRATGEPQTDIMALGHDLEESTLIRWAAMAGAQIIRPVPLLRDRARPWHLGSLDALAILPDGRLVVVDAKYSLRGWGGEIPLGAHLQLTSYMALTGLALAFDAVRGPGGKIESLPDAFDAAEWEVYREAMDSFWAEYVARDTPPDPSEAEAGERALWDMRGRSLVPRMDASAMMLGLESRLAEAEAVQAQAEAEAKTLKGRIAEAMALHGVQRIDFPDGSRWTYVERAGGVKWREYALACGGSERDAKVRGFVGQGSSYVTATHAGKEEETA